MKTNTSYIITAGLLGITFGSGMVLRSTAVNAEGDSVTDTVSITVPVSCTMSGDIDTAHTATINNGIYSGATGSEYENGIGKTTLTTFCNDQNGFSIYAIGFTNDTAGNTNLAGTAASGNANIVTGTATSGSTSNWAMKVNKVDNPVSGDPVTYNPENMTITSDTEGLFSSYHTVPNTYTKVAEYHAATGSSSTDIGTNALGAKITTTYAAYISPTQPADTYTGQVKYVMVHPYDTAAPEEPDESSCNTPVPNLTYMQDLNSSNKSTILASMEEDQQYFLKDSRDEKSYCVAKLKDGNIWMTQNLDFDIVNGGANLNSTNTDVPSNWSDGGKLTDTYATNHTDWSGSGDSESYDPGDIYWSGILDDDTLIADGNIHYHLGNYYNWATAVATEKIHDAEADYDMDQSICPAGWTLPKSGSNTSKGSFMYLVEQYGWNSTTKKLSDGISIVESPLYLNLVEAWFGEYDVFGSRGAIWSSTYYYSTHDSYNPTFGSDNTIEPVAHGINTDGVPIRCLSR